MIVARATREVRMAVAATCAACIISPELLLSERTLGRDPISRRVYEGKKVLVACMREGLGWKLKAISRHLYIPYGTVMRMAKDAREGDEAFQAKVRRAVEELKTTI